LAVGGVAPAGGRVVVFLETQTAPSQAAPTSEASMPSDKDTGDAGQAPSNWRAVLPVHPAAEIFPPLSPDELRAMGEDIRANGMNVPIVIVRGPKGHRLLDGVSRLSSMDSVGIKFEFKKLGEWDWRIWAEDVDVPDPDVVSEDPNDTNVTVVDPFKFVISRNIHRRHLNAEQKSDLIAAVLKAKPELTDREIGRMTKSSPTTVGKKRAAANVQSGHKAGRKEASGRKARGRKAGQPATKRTRAAKVETGDVGQRDAETINARLAELLVPGADGILRLRDAAQLKPKSIADARRAAFGLGDIVERDDGVLELDLKGDGIRRFPDAATASVYLGVIWEVVRGKIDQDDAATSGEKQKATNAKLFGEEAPPANTPAHKPKAVNAQDIALQEFDGHLLRLIQQTKERQPKRFAKTAVDFREILQLANFLFALVKDAGLEQTEGALGRIEAGGDGDDDDMRPWPENWERISVASELELVICKTGAFGVEHLCEEQLRPQMQKMRERLTVLQKADRAERPPANAEARAS
jgi:hypothetical protein